MKKFDYERVCDFDNLYKAYLASRRGKRGTREVIQFEMNAGPNLCALQKELQEGTYRLSGYYHFTIRDPKVREIYALHYRDRILQHCLCDNVLMPYFESHLIYDNAACRRGKGTLFAMNRLNGFLHEHYRKYGTDGYFLKCDVRKFFDHIDHGILKAGLADIVDDRRTLALLYHIIDSYEVSPGKGIPLGNQTSQWFALFYLDSLDRLIKNEMHMRNYIRYMDDGVLLCKDKDMLKNALTVMLRHVREDLKLDLNEKTQIFPIKCGVDFLGFHFYMTDTGKVIRRVMRKAVRRYQRKLLYMQKAYAQHEIELEKIKEVLISYHGHFSHGNGYALQKKSLSSFVLRRMTEGGTTKQDLPSQ